MHNSLTFFPANREAPLFLSTNTPLSNNDSFHRISPSDVSTVEPFMAFIECEYQGEWEYHLVRQDFGILYYFESLTFRIFVWRFIYSVIYVCKSTKNFPHQNILIIRLNQVASKSSGTINSLIFSLWVICQSFAPPYLGVCAQTKTKLVSSTTCEQREKRYSNLFSLCSHDIQCLLIDLVKYDVGKIDSIM